jgi:hypothetical protein
LADDSTPTEPDPPPEDESPPLADQGPPPLSADDAPPPPAPPPDPTISEVVSTRADRVTARADRLARRPAVRQLWRVGGSLAAVGILGFGTLQSVTRIAHEEETIVTELDGSSVRSVSIRNGAGSIHLVGTDSDTVTVHAEVSHGLRSTGHTERIEGDRLVLRASCPVLGSDFCNVAYRVEVPRDVSVELRSDSRITVRDIAGSVDASSDNGRVQATRIDGNVRLESDNGRVVGQSLASPVAIVDSDNGRVELSFAEPPESVSATSDNGSVEVVVPDTRDAYVVSVSSDNGTASGTDVRTDPDSRQTITADSDNGDVTVRYP